MKNLAKAMLWAIWHPPKPGTFRETCLDVMLTLMMFILIATILGMTPLVNFIALLESY